MQGAIIVETLTVDRLVHLNSVQDHSTLDPIENASNELV